MNENEDEIMLLIADLRGAEEELEHNNDKIDNLEFESDSIRQEIKSIEAKIEELKKDKI